MAFRMDAASFRRLVEGLADAHFPIQLDRADPGCHHRVAFYCLLPDPFCFEIFLPSAPTEQESTDFCQGLAELLGDDPIDRPYIDSRSYNHASEQLKPKPYADYDEKGAAKAYHTHWMGSVQLPSVPTEESLREFLSGLFDRFQAQVEVGSDNGFLHLQWVGHKKASNGRLNFKSLRSAFEEQVPRLFKEPIWLRHIPERDFTRVVAYCSKETTFAGVRVSNLDEVAPPKRGKRSDLDRATEYIMSPEIIKEPIHKRLRAFYHHFPKTAVMYHRGFENLIRQTQPPAPLVVPGPASEWQQKMLDILCVPCAPFDRKVYWIWNSKGNAGKSTLVDYLLIHHVRVLALTSGDTRDVAQAFSDHQVVVFDVPLQTPAPDLLNMCKTAEYLKNGHIFCSKYESIEKRFRRPHVVFLANVAPPPNLFADSNRIVEVSLNAEPSMPIPEGDGIEYLHEPLLPPPLPCPASAEPDLSEVVAALCDQ